MSAGLWSAKALAAARRMYAAGRTLNEIAARLGRSYQAVSHKIRSERPDAERSRECVGCGRAFQIKHRTQKYCFDVRCRRRMRAEYYRVNAKKISAHRRFLYAKKGPRTYCCVVCGRAFLYAGLGTAKTCSADCREKRRRERQLYVVNQNRERYLNYQRASKLRHADRYRAMARAQRAKRAAAYRAIQKLGIEI